LLFNELNTVSILHAQASSLFGVLTITTQIIKVAINGLRETIDKRIDRVEGMIKEPQVLSVVYFGWKSLN